MPAAASNHEGAMRPEEWINEPRRFFPFLPDDATGPLILNKEQLVLVSVGPRPPRTTRSWSGP